MALCIMGIRYWFLSDRISHLEWGILNPADFNKCMSLPRITTVEEVIELLERGNQAQLKFEIDGSVILGPNIRARMGSLSRKTVTEVEPFDERLSLKHLPRI